MPKEMDSSSSEGETQKRNMKIKSQVSDDAGIAAKLAYDAFFSDSDSGPMPRRIMEEVLKREILKELNWSSSEGENDDYTIHGRSMTTPPPPKQGRKLKSLEAPVSPPCHNARKRRRSEQKDEIKRWLEGIDDGKEKQVSTVTEAKAHSIDQWLERSKEIENRPVQPLLSVERLLELFRRNDNPHGHHFVLHQHDHPIAGLHYDLRLQISESSSISFAIMYGLPGNPNSKRLNRNATETRVHNLWNHLIETASVSSGSLLIWDTGEYSILPYRPKGKQTEDELSEEADDGASTSPPLHSDSQKLHQAFQQRKIRIRLHGTRLPSDYTLSLRLQSSNNRFTQPEKPVRKRRKTASENTKKQAPSTSDDENDPETLNDRVPNTTTPQNPTASAYDQELEEQENERVRLTNAYSGATNSINSIYQRTWYLSMDRLASGFVPRREKDGTKVWVRRQEGEQLAGFEPFFVRGKEVEKSVVTGRLSAEVFHDEGVEDFVGRRGWRPVLE